MSTFGGLMAEFPDIRVDYFREIPGHRPPLKAFLSHIHSDHLTGLENFKACLYVKYPLRFGVYCSAATKELLIRLERNTNRINFENGILEARKQTYKSLEPRLKTIPLETPTRIELSPNNEIQVTLFDANHCTGAVMFLFEGDGKAVLYTGDIRSEPWFVNNLTRNPFLIEYTSGLKTLDCIYLDTSNTDPMSFPTKAQGLGELLRKVSLYPEDTVFHFSAWTYGYEEVWMALSRALKSQIHVDKYTLRIYKSLRGKSDNDLPSGPFLAHEGPVLTGYTCGNTPQEGCLTNDPTVRIHSCKKGVPCPGIDEKVVWIRPIVTRLKNGTELEEAGIGGGGQDLIEQSQLELDDDSIAQILFEIHNLASGGYDLKNRFLAGVKALGRDLPIENMTQFFEDGRLSLVKLVKAIEKAVSEKQNVYGSAEVEDGALAKHITFPYSRHSSYPELCDLVRAFKPKDVYLCTVNEDKWNEDHSVRRLFGHECSAKIFRHDTEIKEKQAKKAEMLRHLPERDQETQSQTTASSPLSQNQVPSHPAPSTPGNVSAGSQGGLIWSPPSQVPYPPVPSTPSCNVSDGSQGSLPSTQRFNTKTPPRLFSGWSPGSASQGVRRKLVIDEVDTEAKRRRLLVDLPSSSPGGDDVAAKSRAPVFQVETTLGAKSQMAGAKQPTIGRGKQVQDAVEVPSSQFIRSIRKTFPLLSGQAAQDALTASKGNLKRAISLLHGGDASRDIFDIPDDEVSNVGPAAHEHRPKVYFQGGWNFNALTSVDESTKTASFFLERSTQAAGSISTSLNPAATEGAETSAGVNISTGHDSSGESSRGDTPGSEDDSDQEAPLDQPLPRPQYSPFVDENGEEITYSEDYPGDTAYMARATFFDKVDKVLRCKNCGHEFWSSYMGFCTGCEDGQSGIPYYEVLEPGGMLPRFVLNENSTAEANDIDEITFPYLDCNSSAYDTKDEDSNFAEEYEINSFIDDSPEDELDEEEIDPEEEQEVNWEERYRNLAGAHTALSYAHQRLDAKYHGYRMDIEGDEYESTDDSDMGEDFDEDALLVVDVAIPDPIVTELVLSQAREQSQEEEISPQRVRDCVEAFEAASNENGRAWQDISMVSTGDNHTFPEIEL
ncbi:Protein artemis [Lachnellula willkommii]|uniref:Protein artemis n=1 Tax=Lachnellula willkommii TaxID=215461 RepID=A0A559MET2_9HELO|nr:Protein artemis [Lachnellula willkommii]